MVLGGQLAPGRSAAEGPRSIIKGAVALEMRLPLKAGAARDIDPVVGDLGNAGRHADLRDVLDGSHQNFCFRQKGDPHVMVMPNERFRDLVDLQLMRELTNDLGGVRTACVVMFPVRGLEDAVREARSFIGDVEGAAYALPWRSAPLRWPAAPRRCPSP